MSSKNSIIKDLLNNEYTKVISLIGNAKWAMFESDQFGGQESTNLADYKSGLLQTKSYISDAILNYNNAKDKEDFIKSNLNCYFYLQKNSNLNAPVFYNKEMLDMVVKSNTKKVSGIFSDENVDNE